MSKETKRGIELFLKENYDSALYNFSLALGIDKDDEEAKVGALLSTMAKNNAQDAQNLFEYYQILKIEDFPNAYEIINDIVKDLELSEVSYEKIIKKNLEDMVVLENGITYDEFKEIIKSKGNFKRAYEDIFFSTKVFITNKNDYFEFIELLIDNGFKQIALNYLESAVKIFKNSSILNELFKRLENKV